MKSTEITNISMILVNNYFKETKLHMEENMLNTLKEWRKHTSQQIREKHMDPWAHINRKINIT